MQNSTFIAKKLEDFTRDCVLFDGIGVQKLLTAGQANQNIDLAMTDDVFVTGGKLRVKNANFGDTVCLQVVDVNNVLGFGANLVLAQFITNWGLVDDQEQQFDEDSPYPAKVPAGLYLRLVYTSTGTVAPNVIMNWDLHKAKY